MPAPTAVQIKVTDTSSTLPGEFVVPAASRGLVVFAHGSGSSRHSPRNLAVARTLHTAGFATLLFDLLTPREDAADAGGRFDIPLLAGRLVDAIDYAASTSVVGDLPIGLFGASTGAAAALVAATRRPEVVKAVVSRGGRPDLAGDALRRVRAPTLLIVGGRDDVVIGLNRGAAAELDTTQEVRIVDGATHLFEEPGELEQVAQLAADWFDRHLSAR